MVRANVGEPSHKCPRPWPMWPSEPCLPADGVQRRQQPRAAPRGHPARVQHAIADLGYSPNRAARNLRTRASHLVGLRFTPAQEGTANALMDRFVHSLVEASAEAGYHVLLFAGDPEDPVSGYDDLLRATAVDAFVATDTFSATPRPWLEERRRRSWPSGGPGTSPRPAPVGRRRRRRRRRAGHRPPADRGHTRIAWSAGAGLLDRRGPPLRVEPGHASRGLATTGLACRVEDAVASGREAATVLLDDARPTAFVCASDTQAMGSCTPSPSGACVRARISRWSASTTRRSPRWCRTG